MVSERDEQLLYAVMHFAAVVGCCVAIAALPGHMLAARYHWRRRLFRVIK